MTATARGFNPMRWDCEKQGCFNKKRRPRIEVFAECFPRNIAMGDVDGIVEVNHRLLVIEWKSPPDCLKTAQRIMWLRTTRGRMITAVVVVGDPETMEVSQIAVFDDGKSPVAQKCTLPELKAKIKQWAEWAERQPVPKVQ